LKSKFSPIDNIKSLNLNFFLQKSNKFWPFVESWEIVSVKKINEAMTVSCPIVAFFWKKKKSKTKIKKLKIKKLLWNFALDETFPLKNLIVFTFKIPDDTKEMESGVQSNPLSTNFASNWVTQIPTRSP